MGNSCLSRPAARGGAAGESLRCRGTAGRAVARGAVARRFRLPLAVLFALVAAPSFAQPDVAIDSSFTPADPARTWMDVGGAWDGSADISLGGRGDAFSATLINTADSDEPAEALDLVIDLPAGFLYQSGQPLTATLDGPGCGTAPDVAVGSTGPGGLIEVTFSDAGDPWDLPIDCAVTVDFELLADIDASGGTNLLAFDWNYINGGPTIDNQPVEVRHGDPSLAIQPLTQVSTGPPDTVSWELALTNEGAGGLFAAQLDQTQINNNPAVGLQLIPPVTGLSSPLPLSIPNPPGDIATIAYLAADQSFSIASEAEVLSCSGLNNEALARHKVSEEDLSITAQVLLDLNTPQLAYTPFSGTLDYSGPQTFTMPVTNTGDGTAFNVRFDTNLASGGPAVTVSVVGTDWTYDPATGTFTLVGDLGAGPGNLPPGDSIDLVVELEAADVCGDTGGGTIEFEPRYENVCGTLFTSPTDTGSIGGAQPVPSTSVSKSAVPGELGLGSGATATYTVDFTASETDLITDTAFTVTDVLPDVDGDPYDVSVSAGSFTCAGGPGGTAGPCDPGDLVTWTIPNPGDGSTVNETMIIEFTAPTDFCLGGTTLSNTAEVAPATTTQACTIDADAGSAGILLSNVPDPENTDAFSFTVTGGPFETGLSPDDGDCIQQTGEGECIPHQVIYQFPAAFPGLWENAAGETSTYTDDFGGVAEQQLVPDTAVVDLLQDGVAVVLDEPVPAASIIEDTGTLVIDLAFLANLFGDPGVSTPDDSREIRIRYATTVPDAALGGEISTAISKTSQLLVRGGAAGEGACPVDVEDATFTIPTSFTVERASVDVSVSRTDGLGRADVCEVMPIRIDLQNVNDQQAADLLARLQTDGTDYLHLDPPAPVYSGQFDDVFLDYDPAAAGGPTWAFSDPVAQLTGGAIDIEVQLQPGATVGFGQGTPLATLVEYDDNETTLDPPIGGSPTPGRAFSTSGAFTPGEVRQGDLSIQTTPQQLFVTGSQVQWTIFLVNGGSGAAFNARVRNEIPVEFGMNVAATNAANAGNTCGGAPITATNPGGSLLQWDIDTVPAGQTCRIEVVADVLDTTGCAIPDGSSRIAGEWGCGADFDGPFVQQGDINGPYTHPLADNSPNFRFAEPELRMRHDVAFCNLCDPMVTTGFSSFDPDHGQIELLVRNIGATRIEDVEITEILPVGADIDLVQNTVEYSIDGGATWTPTGNPDDLGGGEYRFTQNHIPEFAELFTPSEAGLGTVEVRIRYNITSTENTLPGPHPILVEGQGQRPCDGQTYDFPTRVDLIEVRRPDITVEKTGVNTTNDYTGDPNFVVGLPGETIEWTIEVTNNGDHFTRQSRLRDFLIDQIAGTGHPNTPDEVILFGPGLPAGGVDITNARDAYVALDEAPFTGIAPGDTEIWRVEETLGGNCFNADNQGEFTWGCDLNPAGQPSNLNSPTQNSDTARLLMVPDFSADDAIQQSFTPLPGGRTEITLTMRNDGAPAQDMVVRNKLPDALIVDETFIPVVGGTGGQSFGGFDTGSGAPGDPGSPNHPRILLNGDLGFNETTTVTFQAIQNDNFDDLSDPFISPETVGSGTDPQLPAAGDNEVFIEFSASDLCDEVTPPPATDVEQLIPQTPDIDMSISPEQAIVADGDTQTFTFELFNNGRDDSIGAPVEFRLDNVGGGWTNVEMNVVGTPNGTGGACTTGPPLTCTSDQIGPILVGDTVTIEVTATAEDNGDPLVLIGTAEGSIVHFDGSDTGNDFSFDRARPAVVGFELDKSLRETSEPYTAGNELAVGEDAGFDLRARWFGIDTGGGEAVRGITVRDRLDPDDGRLGYVTRDDSVAGGVSIGTVAGSPPGLLSPPPVVSGTVDWLLDDITGAGGGTLEVDLVTRLLNIPATVKGDTLVNHLDTEFTADFGSGHTFDFASPEFNGGDGELASTSALVVAEPTIEFVKDVRNLTRGTDFEDNDPEIGEGNDEVQYRVTITNVATGTADAPVFGLIIDDLFATEKIELDPGTIGIDTTGNDEPDVLCGARIPGPPEALTFDSDECTFGSPGTSLVQLDPGESITLVYSGVLLGTVNPEEVLDNGATFEGWSLADPAGDRSHTGNQEPGLEGDKDTSDGARLYTDDDIARIVVENETELAKTFESSTSPLGPAASGREQLRVGDRVTWEIVVSLAPQAVIENFQITDTLPQGFAFTGEVSAFETEQLSFDSTPADPTPGAGAHTWDFGDVTVTGPSPELRFTYEAIVVSENSNLSGDQILPDDADIEDRANEAVLTFDTGADPFSAEDSAPVDVPQPTLVLTKDSDPPDSETVGESEPIEYTITLENTGSAPAYDITLEDIVPDGMRADGDLANAITTVSIMVAGDAKTVVDPFSPSGDFANDGVAHWDLPSSPGGGADDYTIWPGETLVLVYTTAVDEDIGAGVPLPNAATALSWWSFDDDDIPAGGEVDDRREYGPSNTDTADLSTAVPDNLDKENPDPASVTIGEEFTWTLTVPGDAANPLTVTLYDVVITDELPDEVTFLDARFVGGGAGGTPEFDFDPGTNTLTIEGESGAPIHIPPDSQAIFEIDARVNNTVDENAGDEIVNIARYSYLPAPNAPETERVTEPDVVADPITITEPLLTADKEARNVTAGDAFGDPLTAPDAGDEIEYRISFTAAAGAERSAAFDLSVVDNLPEDLSYVAGSAAIDPGSSTVPPGDANTIGEPVIDASGQVLTWSTGEATIHIAPGETVSILYRVELEDELRPLTTLTNQGSAQWMSLEGLPQSPPLQRTGPADGVDPPNDYITTFLHDLISADTTVAEKLEDSTPPLGTDGAGVGNYRLGEHVTYRIELTELTQGRLDGFVIRDQLPEGLIFVAGSTVITHDDMSPDPTGVAGNVIAGSGAPGDPQIVEWDFGDVTNSGETLTLTYSAEISADASAGQVFNAAEVIYLDADDNEIVRPVEAPINIVVPDLEITKSTTAGPEVEAGEVVPFTLQLTNTGDGPAYDITVEDIVPEEMRGSGIIADTITTISISIDGGARDIVDAVSPTGDFPGDGFAHWILPSDPGGGAGDYTLEPGATLELVYEIAVNDDVGPGLVFSNLARGLEWWSIAAAADPAEGDGVELGPSDPDSVELETPSPGPMSKVGSVVQSTPGDEFTYTLRVPDEPFGAQLYDVRVSDQLPPNVEFLSAQYAPGSGAIGPLVDNGPAPGDVLTFDPINIPANQVAIIEVTVRHLDVGGGSDGDLFTNEANYTWEQAPGSTDFLIGGPPATHTVEVIEPDLIAAKGGDSVIDRDGAAFFIELTNVGRATAWDVIAADQLPEGMREQPVIDSVTVAGPSPRTLAEGTDYDIAWDPVTGRFELIFDSTAAALVEGETLRIDYTVFLEDDATDGDTLTNVAGATRWATQDGTAGVFPPETRVYEPVLDDGSGSHEDAHSVTVAAPVIEVLKAVDQGLAIPGDTLTYTLTINNTGSADGLFDIDDDIGALDADDAYVPGSLDIIQPPAVFAVNASDPAGGTDGKGLVRFEGVEVPAGGSVVVVFTMDSRPVLPTGTEAINQAAIMVVGESDPILSHDPASGAAPPAPTVTVFAARPDLEVDKTVAVLTGDPDVVAVGDVLEYTIEVRNVGTENTIGAVLVDPIPGNSTYVANSTTLNGSPIADLGPPGSPQSAVEAGLAINSPGSPSGVIIAQAGNPAIITFQVRVDDDLLPGTIISNQATVTGEGEGAGSGVFPSVPSNDPTTPIHGDPTRVVVGAAPLIRAQKTVVSNTTPVVSGPPESSELTYTIVIANNGTAPATSTVLLDEIPNDTTYVAGSTTLNGIPVPDVGGQAPMTAAAGGLPVSSDDLTPPLPDSSTAELSPGESATVTFQVTVNDGVPDGTVISNQGTVRSDQRPDELTDADGNDLDGRQPTTIVVGADPKLDIRKEVFVVGGGTLDAGGLLEYAIRVENIGTIDADNVEITDGLSGDVSYVAGSGRLDGNPVPVDLVGGVVTADVGTLPAGSSTELRFRVEVSAALDDGDTIDNLGRVTADPAVDETATATIDVGGAPGAANFNGRVWLDANLNQVFDEGDERPLEGWQVAVSFGGSTIGAVTTPVDGTFSLRGLAPGGEYTLTFTLPGQTTTFGETAPSLGTPGRQVITEITVGGGANIVGQDMPVTINGTVYEAVGRTPIGGATVNLLGTGSGQAVAAGCFADPTQQGQVTPPNGFYLFELEFGDPSCPAPGDYLLEVTPPAGDFGPTPSVIIPPETDGTTPPYDVAVCDDDALPPGPPGGLCHAQVQDEPPATSIPAGPGTRYYLNLRFSASGNAAQMYNHHLPIDPELGDSVELRKTTPMVNVTRGQLVPYTITATNRLGGPLPDSRIVDLVPPGFKYVTGSATVDGVRQEPDIEGRELTWANLTLQTNEPLEIRIILIVGAGVGEGEYVNTAQVRNDTVGADASREATATVRVVPDPVFDCSDVIGKVFDDRSADGIQQEGEAGLGGVRLTTARGLLITTDAHGRFHIACAAVPDPDRGSNFILKLDESTLPSGYRTTTENPRVVRLTRGKMARINFGATIHRVVRLDLAGEAFRPAETVLRPEWQPRLEPLFEQLEQGPSTLRISYVGDTEGARLAERRLNAIRREITERWRERDEAYDLRIETELYWRRGRPGDSP